MLTLAPAEDNPALRKYIFSSSDVAHVRQVQRDIVATLRAKNYCSDGIVGAELAFIELIGNAVRYAPGQVYVVLDVRDSAAVLHVFDRGQGFDYAPDDTMNFCSESGRGLFIIRQLANSFSINRRTTGGSHARVVLPT